MNHPAISVQGIGKEYQIGRRGARYDTLRDALTRWATAPLRRFRRLAGADADASRFWALKDVSFDVQPGEAIGIIGRNGAGKSTLLKVLSRITEPTTGRAIIRGRVCSLLEVGTGFHPELTGRENVFLNGAILGMSHEEIRRKFDEIVAFAEIEQFLDTPVKHYSSGMGVRLAFAVASHLEPEILIIDEVLAVGDAAFQKKCLGKMDKVAAGGRTVLFVSHDMGAITRLCQRAILLEHGQTVRDGPAAEVTTQYLKSDSGTSAERHWSIPESAPGDAVARLKSVRVLQEGRVSDNIDIRLPVTIELDYWVVEENVNLMAGLTLFNDQGVALFPTADFSDRHWSLPRAAGLYRSVCEVPGNLFSEGRVRVVAEVSTRAPFYQWHFLEWDAVAFTVVESGEPGSVRAGWGRPLLGVVRPMCQWKTEYLTQGDGQIQSS